MTLPLSWFTLPRMADVTPLFPKGQFGDFLKKLGFLPILFVLGLFILPTMFYSVNPDEDAVVLRFGRYHRTEGPGLHLKLPSLLFFQLEDVIKVPVRKIHKMEIGYRTVEAGVRSRYDRSSSYDHESIMLTGDLNVADVEWIVQYQISDAKDFLFNVRHVPVNLDDISQAVMRLVVGDHTVTEVLTTGRLSIETQAFEEMQKILNEYHMGIRLVALKLQDVNPPDVVKPSFNEVNSAKQEAEQMINDAWKEYNKIVPEARGKAEQAIANAQAYKAMAIDSAKGESQRFLSLYNEYRKAPEITRQRLYYDNLGEVLKKAEKVYVIDEDIKGLLPLLSLKGN